MVHVVTAADQRSPDVGAWGIAARAAKIVLVSGWAAMFLSMGCGSAQQGGIRGQRERDDAGAEPVDGATGCFADAGSSCACEPGYRATAAGCDDIDECLESPGICGSRAGCRNVPGSFECPCAEGFVQGPDGCESAPGCAELGLLCHPDAACSEKDAQCVCAAGFTGDGDVCTDIDECEDDTACGAHEVCRNRRGSFVCECDQLSAAAPDGQCLPACEVALMDAALCAQPGALCALDSRGEPSCSACAAEFLGDGKSCLADAECKALACADNSVCQLSSGTRSCACAAGYEGSPTKGCSDVNECEMATLCGQSETCINTPGSYVCACKEGFDRVDGACRDVDECKTGEALCDPNATCENTASGYTCACQSGYEGDGFTCRDIDECAAGTHDCVEADACQNTAGAYSCECRSGYAGDGRSAPCYCDLSGYWAMRQDVTLTVPEQSVSNAVFISETITRATVWELHRYDYDGETIVVEKRGCGADRPPLVVSAYFEEIYSSSVPNTVFDKLPAQRAKDIPLPSSMALPGTQFMTPVEAAVIGISLPDPETSPWPASRYDVPMDDWVDTEMDSVPGISMWPVSTLSPTNLPEAETFSYVPVEFSPGTTVVTRRAGCVSIGTRVKTRLDVDIKACDRWVGSVDNLVSEARVFGCTMLSNEAGETDPVQCDAKSWEKTRRCNDSQVDFLDTQEQQQTATANFELVRIADLDAEGIDCETVRTRLPAIPRD